MALMCGLVEVAERKSGGWRCAFKPQMWLCRGLVAVASRRRVSAGPRMRRDEQGRGEVCALLCESADNLQCLWGDTEARAADGGRREMGAGLMLAEQRRGLTRLGRAQQRAADAEDTMTALPLTIAACQSLLACQACRALEKRQGCNLDREPQQSQKLDVLSAALRDACEAATTCMSDPESGGNWFLESTDVVAEIGDGEEKKLRREQRRRSMASDSGRGLEYVCLLCCWSTRCWTSGRQGCRERQSGEPVDTAGAATRRRERGCRMQ